MKHIAYPVKKDSPNLPFNSRSTTKIKRPSGKNFMKNLRQSPKFLKHSTLIPKATRSNWNQIQPPKKTKKKKTIRSKTPYLYNKRIMKLLGN